tara:strand:+ start:702 stop:1175 length:474 start_codon:yes stop_codon:yes gene_type:complete
MSAIHLPQDITLKAPINKFQDEYEEYIYDIKEEELELQLSTDNLIDGLITIIEKNNKEINKRKKKIQTKLNEIQKYQKFMVNDTFKRGKFKNWVTTIYLPNIIKTMKSPLKILGIMGEMGVRTLFMSILGWYSINPLNWFSENTGGILYGMAKGTVT